MGWYLVSYIRLRLNIIKRYMILLEIDKAISIRGIFLVDTL
jgi:hypothetical protein